MTQPHDSWSNPSYGSLPVPQGAPTLDQPYYGISFVAAVKRAFQKYARFDGRASRSEYWWFALAMGLVFIVLSAIPFALTLAADPTMENLSPAAVPFFVLLGLAYLAIIVPSISIAVRRLHDANYSGLLYLLVLIPQVGGLVMLVFAVLPSNPLGARFDRGAQGYVGQPYPGQPYPGQAYPGQPYAGQPQPPYSDQPYASQPYGDQPPPPYQDPSAGQPPQGQPPR